MSISSQPKAAIDEHRTDERCWNCGSKLFNYLLLLASSSTNHDITATEITGYSSLAIFFNKFCFGTAASCCVPAGPAGRGSWLSSCLAQRVNGASAAVVPRNSLTLSAAVNKRHYGPGQLAVLATNGNESAPVRSAQCRFLDWPFPVLKY